VSSVSKQIEELDSWNEIVGSFPEPHIMQTREWAMVKAQFGWRPIYKVWREGERVIAAAQILMRTVRLGFLPIRWRIMYVPKGPLLSDWNNDLYRDMVLDDLHRLAKENQAIFIKIDADIFMGNGLPSEADFSESEIGKKVVSHLGGLGWIFSDEQVQFRNTVVIDLTQDEEVILSRMKQKTRYNIRLAHKKGVTIRLGSEQDFDLLYRMYAETAARDAFIIREKNYYSTLWGTFYRAGMAQPLVAEWAGEAIAGLFLFHFAQKAWFLFGMSRAIHREKMPNYLLQWEAIRYLKSLGCTEYDLWGAPDDLSQNDPLLNVYRFKQGFGGSVVRHLGAWDLPIKPVEYRLYTRILPKLLALWRWRSRGETQRLAEQGVSI